MSAETHAATASSNAFVAAAATQPDMLPLAQAALIGVAGTEGAMRALIRMADGTIVTAATGARIEVGRLIDVSTAGVVLELTSGNAVFLRPYPWGRDAGADTRAAPAPE